MSNRAGVSPRFDEVKVGDTLPRRVIGPHTIASFTTEYRAFLFNIWGTFRWVAPPGVDDPWVYQDPGWGKDFGSTRKTRRSTRVSAMASMWARPAAISMPTGRAKSAWRAPTATARRWAPGAPTTSPTGPATRAWCAIPRPTSADPAFEGDVTYFDAEIVEKQEESTWGVPLVQVKLRLTNQNGDVLVDCTAEVELPL